MAGLGDELETLEEHRPGLDLAQPLLDQGEGLRDGRGGFLM
jgi:hypothetical protein